MKNGKSKNEIEMAAIAKKWVAALRSGEYDQGKSALCWITPYGVKYCCLGVLHEVIHGEDAWKISTNAWSNKEKLITVNGNISYYGGIYFDHLVHELVEMNDGGSTFNEIADWIEDHV